ncbi:putative microtubule-associated protein, MAP65/Ase1/PRC1 [Helianthus annuus]|nr:putative microtubule-associated protein, MAP65/Ase1/PRC1 [Helianthus annuus]KAJ0518299.1 putative microtubule-associated protein, MAP65/Ase1/PRC1 [Helianthus annuus]KAJ0686333.1 putative microtubule-associated protein, MAP65/Ase1/PRC1 [Helianthus annuus]
MDRIDRWLSACEEDIWLEDYNMDQNRFSGGRSAHISLKRAKRARITIKKIPCIEGTVTSKVGKHYAFTRFKALKERFISRMHMGKMGS